MRPFDTAGAGVAQLAAFRDLLIRAELAATVG
jgi:hypothetical protein